MYVHKFLDPVKKIFLEFLPTYCEYSSEDSNRARTLLRFQFYDEDSIRAGTLIECGLYLRVYGRSNLKIGTFILHFILKALSKLKWVFKIAIKRDIL